MPITPQGEAGGEEGDGGEVHGGSGFERTGRGEDKGIGGGWTMLWPAHLAFFAGWIIGQPPFKLCKKLGQYWGEGFNNI